MLLITCQPNILYLFDDIQYIDKVCNTNFLRPLRVIYGYNNYKKILDDNKNISYWGSCIKNGKIFIFEGNYPENPYNNTSKIISYKYENENLIDKKIEVDDLDFGIHEMYIYENYIYILNTYWQNIIKYNLDINQNIIKESKIIIEPFTKALSYKYYDFNIFNEYKDKINEYRHINSMAFYNNNWYICCPYILSLLKNKDSLNYTKYSEIEIFDKNFNYIDKIILPHKGVHSIIFIDDFLLYLSFDFKLIYFDIIKKEVIHEIELDIIGYNDCWCRGICQINKKYLLVGANNLLQLIDNENKKLISNYLINKGVICTITKIF